MLVLAVPKGVGVRDTGSLFMTYRIAELRPLAKVLAKPDDWDGAASCPDGEYHAEGAVDVEGKLICSGGVFGSSFGGKGGGNWLGWADASFEWLFPPGTPFFPIVFWLSTLSEEVTESPLSSFTCAGIGSGLALGVIPDLVDAGLEVVTCPSPCNSTSDACSPASDALTFPPASCIVSPMSGFDFTAEGIAIWELDKLDKREEVADGGPFDCSGTLFWRKTSRIARRDVESFVFSFLEMAEEYASGSFHTTFSWSGSGWFLEEDEKSLYPEATEKKDDVPDSTAGDGLGWSCDAEPDRTIDRFANSSR